MNVLRTILADVRTTCFGDIHTQNGKDVFALCNLVIIKPVISCTPEQFFNYESLKSLFEVNHDQQIF